jgi:dUTPase
MKIRIINKSRHKYGRAAGLQSIRGAGGFGHTGKH